MSIKISAESVCQAKRIHRACSALARLICAEPRVLRLYDEWLGWLAASLDDPEIPCGRERQVDDSAADERATIVDDHIHVFSGVEIGDSNERSESKAFMRGRQLLGRHGLAARGGAAGFLEPVPRGEAFFGARRRSVR